MFMKKPLSNFASNSKRAEIDANLAAFAHMSSGESQENLERNEKACSTFVPTFNEPTLITRVVSCQAKASVKLIGFCG